MTVQGTPSSMKQLLFRGRSITPAPPRDTRASHPIGSSAMPSVLGLTVSASGTGGDDGPPRGAGSEAGTGAVGGSKEGWDRRRRVAGLSGSTSEVSHSMLVAGAGRGCGAASSTSMSVAYPRAGITSARCGGSQSMGASGCVSSAGNASIR